MEKTKSIPKHPRGGTMFTSFYWELLCKQQKEEKEKKENK